ncbi:flagellar motor protein MotB [Modestobacter sp. NPDC049651]|uniref:flagellar motor protein MotB n=1 Tax=unclassified Modestobacter TaxID=2643866 RepID=UPI0033E0E84D
MSKSSGHGHGTKARRPKKHEEEEHENHERWLVSYADMLTLLFALFVVLYALSQVDVTKFNAFSQGLKEGFGAPVTILDSGAAVDGPTESPLKPVQLAQEAAADGQQQSEEQQQAVEDYAAQQAQQTAAEAKAAYDQLDAARDAIQQALAAAGESDAAKMVINEKGLVVHVVSDPVLFAPESAVLLPQGRTVVKAMAPALQGLPNRIDVEGHANSLPVTRGGPWPSNWELSATRATTVLRELRSDGVPEKRMSATGYSDTQPLVAAGTKNANEINRRVDVVVLSTASAQANAQLPSLEAADQGSK